MPDLAIGLMSGTSCDGVSSALISFQANHFKIIASQTTVYPFSFMQRLKNSSRLSIAEISLLNMELGERFASAVLRLLRKTKTPARNISVIGSHGHTVYHGPTDMMPSTLQLGESSVISHRTGIRVVSNFRARDIAAGGEGAPLVPYFDKAFFGKGAARILLNLGGIANITLTGRNIKTLSNAIGAKVGKGCKNIQRGFLKMAAEYIS